MKHPITWISFWAGFIASMAIRILIEDYYGQQGMIQQMQENWTSPWISVPCAIIGLLIAIYLLWRNMLLEKLLIHNIKKFFEKKPKTVYGTREERN